LEGFNTQFSKSIEQYKSYGISEKTLRAVYRNELLRKKLQDALTADEPATEEQVWARHILVDTEPEAKALYVLLKNGSDFDSLAKKYSKDTGSGLQGGDLGWFGAGMMVPEFETAAFSLPIGEISEPIQTQFGYHIVQVLDRQDLPISESQLQQKRDTAFTEWLASAKENALITQLETWKEQIPPMPDFSNQAQ
jgi:parvulin-like peptidyl-prolyl isomerase